MLFVSQIRHSLAFSLVLLGLLAGGAHAAGFTVPSMATPSIGTALNAAKNGDTTVVADGTYNEQSLSTQGKALTLRSANGPTHCTINAQPLGSVFIIQGGETVSTVIQGFTLENGKSSYGSGINMYCCSPTITNCIFTGRAAVNGGFPAVTNCTFTSNSAGSGSGEILLTAASGGSGGSTPVVSDCDVQGGFAGTSNLNADPLFASAAQGDLHLRFGSPCLGIGSASASAYSGFAQDGAPRLTPPSIGALEAAPLTTHILRNKVNGTASLSNYSPADGTYTQISYGPYSGWTATAISAGY